MSLKDRLQTILGAEDLDADVIVDLPDVPGPDHAIAVATGELATAEVGMVQQEAVIEQVEDDIDELEDRIEHVEDRLEGLESMMNGSRPWNPELAQVLYNDAQKVLVKTFGAESMTAVVGAESFADVDTAQLQLVEGVEKLKEGASNLVAGAKKFFEGLYNAVISFFESIYNAIVSVERQADGVIAKLGKTSDDKIKKSIKLGKWNAYLDIGNGNALDKLGKARAVLSTIGGGLKTQTADSVKSSVTSALSSFVSAGSNKKEKGSSDSTTTSTMTIGGVTFTVTAPKSDAKSAASALSASGISYSAGGEGAKTSGDHASNMTKTALIGMAKKAKSEAANARNSGLSASDLKAAKAKAISALEKTDEGKETGAIIKAGNSAALKISKTLVKYQLDVIRAGVSYVAAHIGGGGGEKPKDEKADKAEKSEKADDTKAEEKES